MYEVKIGGGGKKGEGDIVALDDHGPSYLFYLLAP